VPAAGMSLPPKGRKVMRLTRDVLGAVVLGLAAVGAASAANIKTASTSSAAQHRNEAKQTEHLSKSGSVTFAPGDLSDRVTLPANPALELSHGYEILQDLDISTGAGQGTAADTYRISQKPFSSYEAVIDATSGDIGPTLLLERIDLSTSTVLQGSQGTGIGFSRTISWINATANQVDTEGIRVQSGQCTTDCGPDDVYNIRGYETTYSIPRFNNSGTQITVLLLQNPNNYVINANVYFWNTAGAQIGAQSFVMQPKSVVVFNTANAAPGVGGSVTIAHDGRYGDLAAKTVALEPATGFSFDSPAIPRIK
jgi:hypothetical protein